VVLVIYLRLIKILKGYLREIINDTIDFCKCINFFICYSKSN